jgi:uncharacterized protein
LTRSGANAERSQLAENVLSPVEGGGQGEHKLALAGVALVADPSGALYCPDERLLVVADLHLEKGSAFARRGVLLPPYDTATTLAALARVIARYAPRTIVALGDSFHDNGGAVRMSEGDRTALSALQRGRDWLWIAGNHDSAPPAGIGGAFADALAIGSLTFRHEPSTHSRDGEIAGHLHPLARLARRGHAVSRRCFVSDGRRAIMPAFGAYAGGLNIRDRAIVAVFGTLEFTAHMLGTHRLFAVSAAQCLPD